MLSIENNYAPCGSHGTAMADDTLPRPAEFPVDFSDLWEFRRCGSPAAAEFRQRLLLRGVRLEGVRVRHRDDVVAGIDEMDFAGDAGREVGEKVEPGAAEV